METSLSPPSGSKTPGGKPMSMETYFRLLKKSQMLDQLLSMNSNLHSSEEQLRKLQHEKAKADSVQQRVFQELEKFQKQYVDVQRFFLELVEEMTVLCVKEEQLQLGSGPESALKHAKQVSEERTLQDLQNATLSIGTKRSSASGSSPSASISSSSLSLESQALVTVGRARIKQMTQICADYEQQLVRNEEEFTQAIYSTFTKECLAKIAQSEVQEREHATEKGSDVGAHRIPHEAEWRPEAPGFGRSGSPRRAAIGHEPSREAARKPGAHDPAGPCRIIPFVLSQ